MRCVGVEALARSLNGSPPDLWFDMADRSAAGIEFEVAAVRKAIEAIPALQDGIWVSVNVTPATLSSGHLSEALMDFPQERLVVELSEYAEPSDPDALVDQARVLRSRGVRLAIDDFGAGLCEIRQILDLRPDFIKLHKSLVAGIARDFTKEALIASLVQFARAESHQSGSYPAAAK